jgi:lactoylglutathione lyase
MISITPEAHMKIEHVAIWSKDIETLKRFYESYFGATSNKKYTHSSRGYESYFLDFDSGARLELMHMASIPETTNDPHQQFTGLIHLAISVGSEKRVDDITRALKKAGHEIVGEPRKTGDGYYESVVLDPEGNRIEITV